jgi:hypothetical protein
VLPANRIVLNRQKNVKRASFIFREQISFTSVITTTNFVGLDNSKWFHLLRHYDQHCFDD